MKVLPVISEPDMSKVAEPVPSIVVRKVSTWASKPAKLIAPAVFTLTISVSLPSLPLTLSPGLSVASLPVMVSSATLPWKLSTPTVSSSVAAATVTVTVAVLVAPWLSVTV